MIDFFIVGCPRSGTTLLSKILTSNKNTVIPDETGFLYYGFGFNKKYYAKGILKNKKQIFQNKKPLDCDISTVEEFSNIFRKSYVQNKFFFGEKTPRHWYYLDIINHHYENSKVIFLMRNPISIVNSYKKHRQNWFPFYKASKHFKMDVFFPLFVWKDSLNNFYKYNNSSYCLVQYEELVTDIETTIKEICMFLKIPYEDQMLHFYTTNNRVSNVVARSVNDQNAHKNLSKPINTDRINSREMLNNEDIGFILKYLDKEIDSYYPHEKSNYINDNHSKLKYYMYYYVSLTTYNIVLKKNKFLSNLRRIIIDSE